MNEAHAAKTGQPRLREPGRGFARKYVALLLAIAALVVLGYLAQPYLKLLGPPERCWELQELDGKLYKVNPCTGQFRLLGDAPPAEGPGRPRTMP